MGYIIWCVSVRFWNYAFLEDDKFKRRRGGWHGYRRGEVLEGQLFRGRRVSRMEVSSNYVAIFRRLLEG